MVSTSDGPQIPGDWVSDRLSNTGAWTIGRVWIDRTRRRYAMKVGAEHCNAFGVMHGGAMATFADAQAVAVRNYTSDPENHTPTVTLSVDYLAPVAQGSWLMLESTLLRTTRTLIFTQAVVTVDGLPVARSNAIYRNVDASGAKS